MLSKFEELTELIGEVKKNNKFNLDWIIKEELDEFKWTSYKYQQLIFNSKNEVDFNPNASKTEVKMLEDVLQEAADVVVVISQLDGDFDQNLRDKLFENYGPGLTSTLFDRFSSLIDNFYGFIVDIAEFKCKRTLFRQIRFDYYG